MYQVKVNDSAYQVEINQNQFYIDGKPIALDVMNLKNGWFHILHENRSYTAEIVSIQPEEKKIILRINGREYCTELKTDLDLLLQKMGLNKPASQKINQLKAPMPGLVLSVLVEAGQTIQAGDSILILEAMKMENILKSPGEVKIKSVKVSPKQAVEKTQVLVEFE